MALKLDKSRAYSTVHGDDVQGRKYEQNGHYFNSRGEEWVPKIDLEEKQFSQDDVDAAVAAAVAAALAAKK
jgi:hypothetical protein